MSEIAPLTFTAVGAPAPQGSKKHVGGGRMVESSKQVKPWRAIVADAALDVLKAEGRGMPFGRKIPVEVTATFYRRPTVEAERFRKKGIRTAPSTKPDVDKELRALFDALSGIAYWDDGQVVDVHVFKRWAFDRFHGVDVTVALWVPAAPRLEVVAG